MQVRQRQARELPKQASEPKRRVVHALQRQARELPKQAREPQRRVAHTLRMTAVTGASRMTAVKGVPQSRRRLRVLARPPRSMSSKRGTNI